MNIVNSSPITTNSNAKKVLSIKNKIQSKKKTWKDEKAKRKLVGSQLSDSTLARSNLPKGQKQIQQ